MNLEEALHAAGLQALRAFAEAWGVDVVKRDDPADYVDRILANRREMLTPEAVEHHLSPLKDLPYRAQMLSKVALRQLINETDYACAVDVFHGTIIKQEKEFVEWAQKPNALRHLDGKVVDIYKAVLEAAWEDNVDAGEFRLLERLRTKLGITRRDHRVIELQLGKFPSSSGGVHTVAEIEEATRHLTRRGLVIRVAVNGTRSYCIPTELADVIRRLMGIELTATAYHALLQHVPVTAMREALQEAGQAFSGTRDFLLARLIDGYVSPKLVLRRLSESQLADLLRTFPSVRQEGTTTTRINSVIRHFDQLKLSAAVDDGEHPDETYVSYYVELGSRSYATLRAAGVITNDRNVERLFERATTHLFSEYLGLTVQPLDGSKHADGLVTFEDPRRVLLWDCKSCEGEYPLTDRMARQFLDYCTAAAPKAVTPMLVIAPGFSREASDVVQRLKAQCPPGTEVALITADDLLWLARLWRQRRAKGGATGLPWQVLAETGKIDRATLEKRLKTFAN